MDEIARFSEVRPQRHALSYALKQLVSHEIDLQRMRKEEGSGGGGGGGQSGGLRSTPPQRPPPPVAKESRKAADSAVKAVAGQQPAGEQHQQKEGEEEVEGTSTPRHLQRLQVCVECAVRSCDAVGFQLNFSALIVASCGYETETM